MRTNYILIDFENVQPGALVADDEIPLKVLIFTSENQTKIPFDLAKSIQPLGDKAEYIQISGTGKNALDFHIAYYIGKLAETDPNSYFHIISKDKGFDPLVKHLRTQKVLASRVASLAEVPALKSWFKSTLDERVDAIVQYLRQRGGARPRRVVSLSNTIKVHFNNCFGDNEVKAIVNKLVKLKYVVLDDQKVSYKLPEC